MPFKDLIELLFVRVKEFCHRNCNRKPTALPCLFTRTCSASTAECVLDVHTPRSTHQTIKLKYHIMQRQLQKLSCMYVRACVCVYPYCTSLEFDIPCLQSISFPTFKTYNVCVPNAIQVQFFHDQNINMNFTAYIIVHDKDICNGTFCVEWIYNYFPSRE